MHDVGSLLAVWIGLLLFGPLLALAQQRAPAVPSFPAMTRTRRTDQLYWVFTPVVTGSLTRAATLGTLGLVALARGRSLDPNRAIDVPFPHLATQPIVVQFVLALLVADFVGYWSHRLRHRGALWHFHAVHHSPTQLDWLAAARLHPIDDVIDNVLVGLAVLAVGFSPGVYAALGPAFILHTLLLHANVRWDFGALRFVIASPTYHRWHHALDAPARGVNFAEIFPVIDLVFGTFYLPASERPLRFGTGEPYPESLGAQLARPFADLLAAISGSRAAPKT